ncbi:X-Pro dipeptidyl-peptidase family protein [Fimbriimonas ginsengisoli Gsoil 348]|uniref:X-Pro dipeptidyl-peptidase family protein n=1 Tax=Fimbriimonas ginsengisoli Gsoil 348 TaxID=661478 RepID=A0A068NT74_FIMGI|nr:X-Pro dipeptidyl-peptidase family protein [Fimbriimonas ginsengisoli Gsoil 348]
MTATLLLAASSFAQTGTTVHMTILFNGTPSGENTYTKRADGGFSTVTSLAVGSAKIASKIEGQFVGDKLMSYVVDLVQGPTKVKISVKDGKMTAIPPNGKEVTAPYSPPAVYFGNLHPQLTASLLKAADFDKKETQSITAFLVDSGGPLTPKVTPLQERTFPNGKVRFFRVEFGMATAEFGMSSDGTVVGMDVPGQKLRMVADGWSGIYTDPFATYPELSAPTYKVRHLPTQRMKTRDGVELVQEVYVPEGEGRFPVVFERTPYDRATPAAGADFYVRRGYAYVAQDCRGRTDSGGEWDPFVHELKDGYDALDWIAKQPWCDGNIGMIGGSYDGFVQWAAAASHHPALKCIVPQVSPPLDAMHNLPYDNGIFFLYGDIWWGKIVRNKNSDMSTVLASLPNPNGFKTLPLSKADDATLGYDVPFFDKWLERTSLKDWDGWNFYGELKDVKIPALHISGWWDGDEIGTNMNWEAMRKLGRKNQWLIYGPWTHFFNSSTKLGDTDYGDSAMIDLDTLYIRWFDTWLKHKDVGIDKIPKVQAFVTGANHWVKLPDWPSPAASVRTLFLSSEGPANGLHGKGRLLAKPAAHQKPTEYTYDPSVAVIPPAIMKVDPSKASTKLDRSDGKDLVSFYSDPMVRATAITGPFEVELRFKTSARDTDFIVALLDVDEKGVLRVIGQSGKLRASYIGGFDRPRPLTPGRTYFAKIKPWDTAHEFKPGHRFGLMIAPTGFPMFSRNLGTGEPIKDATRMVKQHNTLFHDSVNPSIIRFRVLWE